MVNTVARIDHLAIGVAQTLRTVHEAAAVRDTVTSQVVVTRPITLVVVWKKAALPGDEGEIGAMVKNQWPVFVASQGRERQYWDPLAEPFG